MKLCRFHSAAHPFPRIGLTLDDVTLLDLSGAGVGSLTELLESPDLVGTLKRLASGPVRRVPVGEACFVAPTEQQEVWAAGVTYLRSKAARSGSVRTPVGTCRSRNWPWCSTAGPSWWDSPWATT
jgi:2-dehydro-3-deoxy-D-arabinonate dehydratase